MRGYTYATMQDWVSTAAIVFAALAITVAGGKAEAKRVKPSQIDYTPTAPVMPQSGYANGSIFQASNGYSPLTSGQRAAMVGDVLTIVLVERTQASKSTSAKAGRSGSIGLTPPVTGPASFFQPSDIAASGTNSFDGKGEASQSNQLNGQITVTIAAVYPNGTMLVRGEKMLTLNRGDETIQIAGIIRAADIAADNTVSSSRVADAKITYVGKGEIARSSKQGWLQRFFTRVSPF